VIWEALTARQARFAESFQSARGLHKEVTSLCAFEEPSGYGYTSLAGLLGAGGTGAVFLNRPYEPREGWDYVAGPALLEMMSENSNGTAAASRSLPEIVDSVGRTHPISLELTDRAHQAEAFCERAPHELGCYLGIRDGGKIVAFGRLKGPGYTEVSAVCTHPDHPAKGTQAF